MDTRALIEALAADARRPATSLSCVWWGAAGLSAAFAVVVVGAMLGLRPDIAAAAQTPRFLLKFGVMITLSASAFCVARALSRPGEAWRKVSPYLAAAPALLAMAVIAELIVVPPESWSAGLMGMNAAGCLASIMLVGIGPLAMFLIVLRYGAPTRPAIAGAMAGLLAGAIAATFYAAHCPDDSPLFLATWYTIAIAGLALVGAAGAKAIARW